MAMTLIQRGYQVVSGGTDDHLFLVDLINKNITGKAAEAALGQANITVNKNAVPNDPKSPFITSGIRIGTPAVTTRGLGTAEVRQVAHWIGDIIDNIENIDLQAKIKAEVLVLCTRFPVYG